MGSLKRILLIFMLGGLIAGCAKVNDNTQSATVFINRGGSALHNQQVNNGLQAYLAVDPMYSQEFNQVMRSFYLADNTSISGNIDPVNGVTFNMQPFTFSQSGQAVINQSSPPMMTVYTKASQTFAVSLALRSGGVANGNMTLTYSDQYRQITIYAQCAANGIQGPVSYIIANQQGLGEQLLGYFSMPGLNNFCQFTSP